MKLLFQIGLLTFCAVLLSACGGSSSAHKMVPQKTTEDIHEPPIPTPNEETPSTDDKNTESEKEIDLSACESDLLKRYLANTSVTPVDLLNLTNTHGLELINTTPVNQRTVDVTFESELLTRAVKARVVLPANYSIHCDYPVLYLLHGGGGTHEDWTLLGVDQATTNMPLIVIQVDGGKGSWFANAKFPSPNGDWLAEGILEQNIDRFINGFKNMDFGVFIDAINPIPNGPPQWESYIIEQLIPWVDANLSTRAQRSGRAIAGLSMGGYGAMSYITRYPELFIAGASFSGAVDTRDALISQWIGVSPLIEGRLPYTIFGPYGLDSSARQAHNPTMNVSNMLEWRDDIHLAFYYGNGNAGDLDFTPLDQAQSLVPTPIKWLTEGLQDFLSNTQLLLPDLPNRLANPMGWIQEQEVFQMNLNMHSELAALGIPYRDHGYGDGMHTGTYWKRSLQQELPYILKAFGALPPPPISRALPMVGKNLIIDGDFEMLGMGPWQCLNTCGVDENKHLAYNGNNNGYAAGSLGRNEIRQTVNVLPQHHYQLTAWLRTSSTIENGYFGARNIDGTNIKRLLLSPLHDYTQIVIEFETNAQTELEIYANVAAIKGRDAWLQIDDVSLIASEP